MKFSKVILSLSAALSLAACSTESNKKKDIVLASPTDYEHTGNFQVSSLRVTHSALLSFNSYGLPASKIFTFEACLVDQLNGSIKEPNLLFSVSDSSGTRKMVRTDRSGCLLWTETHSFSYLLPETYFRIKRIIESHSYYKGQVVAVGAFNPWMDGDAAFVNTLKKELPPHIQVQELDSFSIQGAHLRSHPEMAGLKMNLTGATFDFLGLDYDHYEITPRLALRVAHRYQVRLSPVVFRQTLSNIAKAESLVRGTMRVVFVILREDGNEATQFNIKNVVASTEFEQELEAGHLQARISILFPEIASLTSRTVALMTLIPLDELDGLPSLSFSGPLKPGHLSSLNLTPVKQEAVELHRQFQQKLKKEMRETLPSFTLLTQNQQYRALGPEVKVEIGRGLMTGTEKPLLGLIEKGVMIPPSDDWGLALEIRRSLCNAVFPKEMGASDLATACRRNPSRFVDYKAATFLERLNSTKVKPVGLPTVDTMTMSTSISTSQTTSTSAGLTGSVGLNFGYDVPFSQFGGLKFSLGGQYSHGYLVKRDKGTSTAINRARSITAEGRSYEIDAMTRVCFVASALPEVRAQHPGKSVGLYHCEPSKSEKRVETYYLVNSKTGVDGSPHSDNGEASSTFWRMVIRGPRLLNLFAEAIQKPFYELVLFNVQTEEGAYEAVTNQYLTEEFPGVFSE